MYQRGIVPRLLVVFHLIRLIKFHEFFDYQLLRLVFTKTFLIFWKVNSSFNLHLEINFVPSTSNHSSPLPIYGVDLIRSEKFYKILLFLISCSLAVIIETGIFIFWNVFSSFLATPNFLTIPLVRDNPRSPSLS